VARTIPLTEAAYGPMLRYTFATSLLEDGDYLRTIHEFLRHQDVNIRQRVGWQMAYTLSVRWRGTWEIAVQPIIGRQECSGTRWWLLITTGNDTVFPEEYEEWRSPIR
jgi:hypothetical protein